MNARAALIGINLKNGEIVSQIFVQDLENTDPIKACEKLRVQTEASLGDDYTFTIIPNEEARTIYAANLKG